MICELLVFEWLTFGFYLLIRYEYSLQNITKGIDNLYDGWYIDATKCSEKCTFYHKEMLEAISITEARQKFLPLLSKIESEPYRFMVTKHGKPVAVVLDYAEYSRMVETLKLLEDRQWSQRLDQGLNQARGGVMLEINSAGSGRE